MQPITEINEESIRLINKAYKMTTEQIVDYFRTEAKKSGVKIGRKKVEKIQNAYNWIKDGYNKAVEIYNKRRKPVEKQKQTTTDKVIRNPDLMRLINSFRPQYKNFQAFIETAMYRSAMYNTFLGMLLQEEEKNSKLIDKVEELSQEYFNIWSSALKHLGGTEEQENALLEGNQIEINGMTIEGADVSGYTGQDILNYVDVKEKKEDVYVPYQSLKTWKTSKDKELENFKNKYKYEMGLIK